MPFNSCTSPPPPPTHPPQWPQGEGTVPFPQHVMSLITLPSLDRSSPPSRHWCCPALNPSDQRVCACKAPKSGQRSVLTSVVCELARLTAPGIVTPCQSDSWNWCVGVFVCFNRVTTTWASRMGSILPVCVSLHCPGAKEFHNLLSILQGESRPLNGYKIRLEGACSKSLKKSRQHQDRNGKRGCYCVTTIAQDAGSPHLYGSWRPFLPGTSDV